MDSAVIATLVSAFVSIAGVCVSIYLARRATNTAIQQTHLSTALRLRETSLSSLKIFAAEVERARIACWQIRWVGRFATRGGVTYKEVFDSWANREEMAAAILQFETAWQNFEKAWADAKVDVPAGILEYVRVLRHEGLAEAHHLSSELRMLKYLDANSSREKISSTVVSVDKSAAELLLKLDQLAQVILSAIWSVIDQVERPSEGTVPSRRASRD